MKNEQQWEKTRFTPSPQKPGKEKKGRKRGRPRHWDGRKRETVKPDPTTQYGENSEHLSNSAPGEGKHIAIDVVETEGLAVYKKKRKEKKQPRTCNVWGRKGELTRLSRKAAIPGKT